MVTRRKPSGSLRHSWLRYSWKFCTDLRYRGDRDEPEPEKRQRFRITWARVCKHCDALERKVWAPLRKAVDHGVRRQPELAGRWGDVDADAVCALVLEVAIRWAIYSKGRYRTKRAAADRLQVIEHELRDTLYRALVLFEEREQLSESEGLRVEFPVVANAEKAHRLIKASMRWPYPPSPTRIQDGRVLKLERTIYGLRPDDVGANCAVDREVLRPAAGGSPMKASARVRQFLAALSDRPRVPCHWVEPKGLAVLLSVVDKDEPFSPDGVVQGEFNAEAVGTARRRYLEAQNTSTDNL